MRGNRSRVRPEFASAVRDALGSLSQSEAAIRTQISVGYINRMARGTVPSEEIVRHLAEGLGVSPDSLLRAAGYAATNLDSGAGERISRRVIGGADPDESDVVLGPEAAAQYERELWDRVIRPGFPDAEMPAGASQPRTRGGIRSRILRALAELMEEDE